MVPDRRLTPRDLWRLTPQSSRTITFVARILLLDGNSIAYRAFFALPTDMATASGQVTNAVFGFTSMLVNLLKDHHPDGIAVAFDRPEPTFRHEMVSDYNAGRTAAPDILRQQMGLVRQVVETLSIPILEIAGFEADDIVATLATQGRDRGDDVIIVTGDRDEYQLVEDPHIKVLYMRRGVSDHAMYDEAGIIERTGVHPTKYPEYAALRGDPSDNLPGVPGVGEKTAAKLINDYGDLDGIFANLDKCTPKLRQNLADHEEQVRSNARATPLVRDVPVECDVADLRMGGWNADEVRKLFNFLEFRTLWDRLVEAVGAEGGGLCPAEAAGTIDVNVRRAPIAAAAVKELDALCASVASGPVAVMASWPAVPGRTAPRGVAITDDPAGADVLWISVDVLESPDVAAAFGRLVAEGGRPLQAHGAKELMRGLQRLGIEIHTLDVDLTVAAYLVDPADTQYLLEDVALRFANLEVRSPDGPPAGQLDLDGTHSDDAEETARRAAAVIRTVPAVTPMRR